MTRHRLTVLIILLNLAMIAPVFAQGQEHLVQPGENLYRIALRYGVGMEAIIKANNLADPRRIFAGQRLIIPNFDPAPEVVENPTVASAPAYHTVRRGETLDTIARLYGLTREQILKSNNISNPNLIYAGQQLLVWGPPVAADATTAVESSAPPAEAVPTTTYIVQPGEHLAQIARRFGVSVNDLVQANNLANPNFIFFGQSLVIPNPTTAADLGILTNPQSYGPAPTPPTIFSGRQVVVDLTKQRVYAYENGNLLRDVVVSTGLPATPTVTGHYKVYRKYTAQTMSGPGYYLPGVPYVMYFYQGYALHGTYWHNNFGQPMSHGCVNLPTPEAEWFFTNFVDVGTSVYVTY